MLCLLLCCYVVLKCGNYLCDICYYAVVLLSYHFILFTNFFGVYMLMCCTHNVYILSAIFIFKLVLSGD